MEKLYPSNKVRFRHLYDKTDKEEQILFYRCSLMVETYRSDLNFSFPCTFSQ